MKRAVGDNLKSLIKILANFGAFNREICIKKYIHIYKNPNFSIFFLLKMLLRIINFYSNPNKPKQIDKLKFSFAIGQNGP